jgi:hypothetical protein
MKRYNPGGPASQAAPAVQALNGRDPSKRMTATKELPQFVRDLLAAPPRRGGGLNRWFFRTARVLHAFRSPDAIVELLYAATHGAALQPGEIERAVNRSYAVAWRPGEQPRGYRITPPWPATDRRKRAAIIAVGIGLYDLWELSPVRFDDDEPHGEEIIDILFPGNPLLCCGLSNAKFATRPREDWRGQLAGLQFIVPSAMTAPAGLTQDGKRSAHCLNNTGPRQHLIIEHDGGMIDEQAAILRHLGEFAPLVLALHSGGRSLHGWFACAAADEETLARFMRYAVSLGADPALSIRSQFARMPDGARKGGARQTVFYFNPEALSLEIVRAAAPCRTAARAFAACGNKT